MTTMQVLGVLGLTALLVFGVVSQAFAENHDGVPGRREGTTRLHKQPPRRGEGAIVVVTPLFAVMEL